MAQGGAETMCAYYSLQTYNMMPWDFAALDPRKKGALIAMIQERLKAEKNIVKK